MKGKASIHADVAGPVLPSVLAPSNEVLYMKSCSSWVPPARITFIHFAQESLLEAYRTLNLHLQEPNKRRGQVRPNLVPSSAAVVWRACAPRHLQ